MVQMKFKDNLLESSFLLGKTGLFLLFRTSATGGRPTYVMQGNLFYLEFIDFCGNFIPQHSSKLTHNINHDI